MPSRDEQNMNDEETGMGKIIVSIVIAILILIGLFSSYTVIKPGNVGVVFNKMNGSLYAHSQGIVFRIPFVTTVQSYPVSLRTYSMVKRAGEGSNDGDDSIDLPTKEGQHIKQDLSVTYNTSEKLASEVFKAFRGDHIKDIESTFIRRTIITNAQNIAGQMSLSELISTGRDKLQNEIQEALSIDLAKMGFNLDKVNLGASHLPKAIEDQMQSKMAAQQQAMQADYELQKKKTLAKAAVAEAEGVANSQIILANGQAQANKKIQTTITPELIEYKKIEKWDGVLPKVVTDRNSLINISADEESKKSDKPK